MINKTVRLLWLFVQLVLALHYGRARAWPSEAFLPWGGGLGGGTGEGREASWREGVRESARALIHISWASVDKHIKSMFFLCLIHKPRFIPKSSPFRARALESPRPTYHNVILRYISSPRYLYSFFELTSIDPASSLNDVRLRCNSMTTIATSPPTSIRSKWWIRVAIRQLERGGKGAKPTKKLEDRSNRHDKWIIANN